MRGVLTEKIQEISKERLGYEISHEEFRLMPYTQYVMMNEQRYDRAKINEDDEKAMKVWEEKGFIKRHAFFSLEITKEFWDAINEILYWGYVFKENENS